MCHEKKNIWTVKTQNSDLADFLSRLRQKRHQELEMCLIMLQLLATFSKILWPDLEKLIKMSVVGPKLAIFDSYCPGKAKTRFFGKKRKCHFRKLIMPQLCAKKISKILWPDLEKLIKMSVFGPKWAIFDSFCPGKAKTRFFGEKRKCHFRTLLMLQLCAKKLAKSYDRIWRNWSKCPCLGQN